MNRALPSFAAAISVLTTERPGALDSAKKSKRKGAMDIELENQKQNPSAEEEPVLLDKDEVMQYQSDVAEVALRIKQTLRDMDGISLRDKSSTSTHSNQMQFIEDQCQRARMALPIEYYSRQLQYKQVARKIIEVDERVEYNNRTWRRALKDLDIDDQPEQPKPDKTSKQFPPTTDTDIIGDDDAQAQVVPKEDKGYDSDDLSAVEKELTAFMSMQSESSPTKDTLNNKYQTFTTKALQTMRTAIINGRKTVLRQIASFNSTIHERESQLSQLKLQLDQMDAEIKEFMLADQIVKEVVEGRFKGSMNQLNDHLLKQRQDLLDAEEVIEKLSNQKIKINNMIEEIRVKRGKADPFVKKRANDLVKGLLAKLDDKDAQLQEDREGQIREQYNQLMEYKRKREEALRRLDVVEDFFESKSLEIITQTERIAKEKIIFKEKAQALKLADEEMTAKLQRIEATMAEYARAERRRTHLEAKRLGTGNSKSRTSLIGPEVMSTEGFIAALDQKFAASRNPSMSLPVDQSSDDEERDDDNDDRDFIEVNATADDKKSRESTPGRSSKQSKQAPETETEEEDNNETAQPVQHKKKNYKDERPQPLQLVDDETEALLGINTNEELRQTMTKQPLSKATTVEEALRLSPEFRQLGSPPSPDKFDAFAFPLEKKIVDPSIRFTPLLLEDSDTDLDAVNVDELSPLSPRHTTTVRSRKSTRNKKATFTSAVSDAALMPVTSSICTASYVKFFQDFSRRGPLASSSNSNTPKISSFLRQQSFTFQQSPKPTTRGGGSSSRRVSSRQQFESFQFDLNEGIKVVMEALDRLRLRECIDSTKATSLRQDLIALAAVIQLQALTDESRSAQFKLHKLCQAMLVATIETAPKALLVSNTRSLFAEVLACLFAILGVIFNCSLSFWEPAARAALSGVNIPFVEQLSKQVIETVLTYGQTQVVQEQKKKQLKMVDFHALIEEIEDEQDNNPDTAEAEEINPFLLIATMVGVLQRTFSTNNPDRIIAPLVEITLDKLDSLFPDMSLIAFLHRNPTEDEDEGESEGGASKKQKQAASSIYSPTFETPHRNSLGIISAFLLSIFSTHDFSTIELTQTFETVQREGEEIGIVKSSYSMPRPLLNLTDLDDLLSNLCFPQILPAVLSLELLKRCIDEDLSRRLFLQRVAEQDRSVAELQYLNVDMPVTAEFHMQSVNRMMGSTTTASNNQVAVMERGNSTLVRPAAASRSFRLKSTAEKINELQTTDENKPQPVPPLGPRESFLAVQKKSLLPAIFKQESSSVVSSSVDGRMSSIRNSMLVFDSHEMIARENETKDPAQLVAEAIARLRLQQQAEEEQKQSASPPWTTEAGVKTVPTSQESARQHSSKGGSKSGSNSQSRNKSKINNTPTTTMDMQELHERWLDEREKYVIHLCQQIHDMVWFAPSTAMTAEEKIGEQERHLPLPEPLVFKLLAHIEKVRKIIHARSPDGAILMRATEHEFRQVVIELRIVQRKILRVINAMTLPMRRRLLWLQDKFSKVNDENRSNIKFIEETQRKADRIRKDTEDLRNSLKIIQMEKSQPGFKGAVNLLKHSLEVQRMILEHATQEVSERVKRLKDREAGLQEILDGMIAEYGKLVGQEVSLQNAQKDLLLQPAFQSSRYRQRQDVDGALSSDEDSMSYGYSLIGGPSLDFTSMTSLSMQSSTESKALLDTPVDEILSYYSNQASSRMGKTGRGKDRGHVSFFSDEDDDDQDDSVKVTSSRDTFTLSGRHLHSRMTVGIPYNNSQTLPGKSHQRLTHRWQQMMNNSQHAQRRRNQQIVEEKQRRMTSEDSVYTASIPQKIFGFGKRIDRGLHALDEEKRNELQARIKDKEKSNKEAKLAKQKSIQSATDESMSSAPAIYSTDWKDGRYHTAHIIPSVCFESRGQKVAVYNQDQITHRRRHFFHRAFQLPRLNPFIRYDHSHDSDNEGGGQWAWEGIFTPLNLRKLLQIQQKMTKLATSTATTTTGGAAEGQAEPAGAGATETDTEQQQTEAIATLKKLSISFGSDNSNQPSRVITRKNTMFQQLVDQHNTSAGDDESRRGSLVFPNHPPMLGHQMMITTRMKRGKHMSDQDPEHEHEEASVVLDDESTKPSHMDDDPEGNEDSSKKHVKLLSLVQSKVEPGSKAAYDQWQKRRLQRSLANHRRYAHITSQQAQSDNENDSLDEAVQESEGYRTLRRFAHENLDRSIQSLIFSVMNHGSSVKKDPASTRRVTRRRAASPLAFGSLSVQASSTSSTRQGKRRTVGIHEHHEQHESKQREQMLAEEQAWQNEILSYLGDYSNGVVDMKKLDLLAIPRDETFADQTYAGAFKGDLAGEGMLASVQELKKQFPQAFQPSSKESVSSKKPSTGVSRAASQEYTSAEEFNAVTKKINESDVPPTSSSDRGSTTDSVRVAQSSSCTTPMILARLNESNVIPPPFLETTSNHWSSPQPSVIDTSTVTGAGTGGAGGISYLPWNTAKLASAISMQRTNEMSVIAPLIGVKQLSKRRLSLFKRAESMMHEIDALEAPRRPSEAKPSRNISVVTRRNTAMKFDDEDA